MIYLLLICLVVFMVVFSVVWEVTKLQAPRKPVGMRNVLAKTAAVSAVLLIGIVTFLANGSSSLPNQQ